MLTKNTKILPTSKSLGETIVDFDFPDHALIASIVSGINFLEGSRLESLRSQWLLLGFCPAVKINPLIRGRYLSNSYDRWH